MALYRRHRGYALTLLGFAIGSDRVVIAADGSMHVDTDGEAPPRDLLPYSMIPVHKIRQIAQRPLYWAIIGDAADYRRFVAWIDEEPAFENPSTGWDDLSHLVGKKMLELSTRKSEGVQQSSVMVAGQLDASVDVFMAGPDGNPFFPQPAGITWGFIGPVGPTANAAWQVAKALDFPGSLHDEDVMRRFMRALHTPVPEVGEPFDAQTIVLEPTC